MRIHSQGKKSCRSQVPHSLRVTQVALLPKSDEHERPISLTSIWWRVYAKFRRSLLEDWMREYKTPAPQRQSWTDVSGCSCPQTSSHGESADAFGPCYFPLFGYCRLLRHCSS